MDKKILGVDIDGVLIDCRKFELFYGIKFCIDNKIPYSINTNEYTEKLLFNWSDDMVHRFWNKYREKYCYETKAISNASEILHRLKQKYKIVIITSRLAGGQVDKVNEFREMTLDWLEDNDIPYDDIVFTKSNSKLDIIKKEKVDIMIEDCLKHINEIKEYIPVICYDYEYNRDIKELKNIKRVYSWDEIYNILNNL